MVPVIEEKMKRMRYYPGKGMWGKVAVGILNRRDYQRMEITGGQFSHDGSEIQKNRCGLRQISSNAEDMRGHCVPRVAPDCRRNREVCVHWGGLPSDLLRIRRQKDVSGRSCDYDRSVIGRKIGTFAWYRALITSTNSHARLFWFCDEGHNSSMITEGGIPSSVTTAK
jgi:hypothetical protein